MTLIHFDRQERQERAGGVWDYVSVSRLQLWLKCPLAFKLRYVDGLETPPSPSQFLGRRVHTALEFLYRQRMLGGEPSAAEIEHQLLSDWQAALVSEGNPFGDQSSELAAREQAAQLVTAYRRGQPEDDRAPRAVETALRVPLVDPLTGQDLGIPLVGIIDLVLDGPAGPTIVDFKTAARGGQPPAVMHELQLTAYSYLLRQATGQREQGLEIRQLVKGRQPRLERYRYPPRTDPQLRRLFAVLRSYLSALDRREFFFRPGLACTSCEHQHAACQRWTP